MHYVASLVQRACTTILQFANPQLGEKAKSMTCVPTVGLVVSAPDVFSARVKLQPSIVSCSLLVTVSSPFASTVPSKTSVSSGHVRSPDKLEWLTERPLN